MPSRYADLPPHKAVDKRFEDNYPLWRPKYDAMHELSRFLSGDRYVNDGGAFNKDRRGVQIRGQDIQDTIRHVVAKATEKPRSIEARPIDTDTDPDAAELMQGLVTNELSDPYKGFERERYAAIQSCREMRLGVVWMDYVPDFGAYGGEIMYSWQSPDRIMWEAPYHPHHPLCGWLIRDKRINVDEARDTYSAPWLEPDRGALTAQGNWKAGTPLIQGYNDWLAATCINDDKVTVRECWYKNDKTLAKNKKPVNYEPLKPEDRYLSCQDGCGFRSDTQATLASMGAPKALPEQVDTGCPVCGGHLTRVDATQTSASVLAYSKGRRLVISAPYSPNPNDEPLYDGQWPIAKARSFPGLFLFASVKPGDVMGPCDVDWMWDQQVAQDNLDTLAVQRVFEHRNYWIMPEVGINDYRRKRFEFREDQQNLMFRDMTKAKYGPLEVQNINGTGLDPAWGGVRSVVSQNLTRYVPKSDIGLVPGEAHDIPVGTTQLVQEQAETSTKDFITRCNQELSMFYGVVADYISATYTPERMARLNIDGTDFLLQLKGDDLPNFDFVVTETPDFTGIDKEKSQAFDQAMGVAMQMGPEALDAWGQFHNVPKSVIRTIQKLFQEKQAQAEQMAAQGMAPGAAGGPGMAAMESPAAPPTNGPSGGGMMPSPVG